MARGRIALIAAAVALLVGGAIGAVYWNDGRTPAPRDEPARQQGDAPGITGRGEGADWSDDAATAESREETRVPGSDVEALDGERVPTGTVYELVDVLSAAGVPPVMDSTIVVEYAGRLNAVLVTGRFTGTQETTLTLEHRDGSWRLKE